MKLYTRTGDDGSTGLFGGPRVSKDDARVEAYGTVDELNATVGLAIAGCIDGPSTDARMRPILIELQSRLFDLGADLATPVGSEHESKLRRITESDAGEVERWIDDVDSANDPMRNFVLPGGTEAAARLHVARTVCRRAERRVVALGRTAQINSAVAVYLNRVSDLLFAMARRANKAAGVPDVPWTPRRDGA